MTATEDFYKDLPEVTDFQDLADATSYTPLPDDWSVAVADVVNSTKAIEAGKYKSVNTVGASVIAAVLNAVRPIEIPYVFGGDGASVCIPNSKIDDVRHVLSATLEMAMGAFGLEVRAGIVPIPLIRENGRTVLIARHRVSKYYVQGAVHGGGLLLAERMLKTGGLPEEYVIHRDASAGADYSGVECRWKEIPSPSEETVALIIESAVPEEKELGVYRKIIDLITEVYGHPERYRPVTEAGLSVAFSPQLLWYETRLKTWAQNAWERFRFRVTLTGANVVGWFFFRFGTRTSATDWGSYKPDLVSNTDFRKFDGVLRFVVAGTERQRLVLEGLFAQLEQAGEIRYGIHVAASALMTCLVVKRQGEHFHFVDASGGGYALAARMMKQQQASHQSL